MFENLFAFLGPMSSSLVLLSVVLGAAIVPMSQTCPLRHGHRR